MQAKGSGLGFGAKTERTANGGELGGAFGVCAGGTQALANKNKQQERKAGGQGGDGRYHGFFLADGLFWQGGGLQKLLVRHAFELQL